MLRARRLGLGGAAIAAVVLGAMAGVLPAVRPTPASAAGPLKVAYYDQWSIYGNAFYPRNLETNGAASKLDVLVYDFENIDPVNLTCFEAIKAADAGNEQNASAGDGAGDAFADYQKSFDASISVDGVGDVFSQPLKGNFNQLKKLKARHPNLRIVVSLGGWTYSKYFSDAALTQASRQKFVGSCIDMFLRGNLPTGILGDPAGGQGVAAGIFDGFDLDWEYPGVLGHTGNHVRPEDKQNFTLLLQEFRSQLDAFGSQNGGKHYLLTAALAAGQDKIAKLETNKIGPFVDFIDVMTYDMHGAWEVNGPTNFQSPLHDSPADPSAAIPPGSAKYNIDTAITAWTTGLPAYGIPGGFPASKINLGIPFYARGWTGVPTGANHGLYQSATGPTSSFSFSQTPGVADFKELVAAGLTNPANMFFDSVTQSAWIYSGNNFYTLDTPQTIAIKDQYIMNRGLAGAFVFSLKEDDASTTLLNAVVNGLQSGGPTPTPTATSTPTPTPSATPTATPTPTPTATPTPTPTPTATPPAGNLLANPGFESGSLSPWSCEPIASVVSSPVHSGTRALKGAADNSNFAQCTQRIAVQPNHQYTLSGWVQGSYVFIGATGTGTTDVNTWTPGAATFAKLSVQFTTGGSTTSVTIFVHGWYAQGTYFADDLSVI